MTTAHEHPLALNQACSQADRLRTAPAPGRVQVDGRSLTQLLGFAADYGTLIRFYDLADTPDGDWSAFFLADPSVALALRAGLDLDDIEAGFDRLLQALRAVTGLEARLVELELASRVVLRLVRIFEHGQVHLASLEEGLAALVRSHRSDLLAAPARRLLFHLGGHPPGHGLRRELLGFVNGWFDGFLEGLEELFAALVTALAQERSAARAALEASLHSASHPPQAALWDAFVQLFGHAQNALNRFPRRLLDFYQTAVLHQDSRAGRPDQLVLTFTPAKGVAEVALARGTRFLAGTDGASGESIVYALDEALTVDATAVAALRTLTVSWQAPVPGALPAPAQVLGGVVALSPTPPAIATPFPIFGATTAGTDGVLTSTQASLGFAVASPCLMLTGGGRNVQLGLAVTPDSLAAAQPLLAAIGQQAGGMAPDSVLAQLLQGAFALRYSTAGGWIDIPAYAVTPPAAQGGAFTLSFTLDPDASPWVALSTQPPDANAQPAPPASAVPDADTPVLLARLLQDPVSLGSVTVYPYAVLSGLALSGLSIDVAVNGLTQLQLTSPTGPADTSQPFALFGAPPVQHAALSLRAPELFAKQLGSFALSIDWFGLPVTSTGFAGYYKGYVVNADGQTVAPGSLFDNLSFTGHLEVVNPGTWQLDTTQQALFQTAAAAPSPQTAPLLPRTTLAAAVSAQPAGAYYDPSMSAVRLSLDQPSYAFGNVLYAANVMAASVQLTAAASACAQKCGGAGWSEPALAQLELLAGANAGASDGAWADDLKAAVQRTVASLDGEALGAIQAAIAASGAPAAQQAQWQGSLSQALGGAGASSLSGLWHRLFGARQPDAAAAHAQLQQWLTDHAAALGATASAQAQVQQAQALLAAGTGTLALQAQAEGQPASTARTGTAAGIRGVQAQLQDAASRSAQACIQDCLACSDASTEFPNQPWLPLAASVSVQYTAGAALPPADGSAAAGAFFHLAPFDTVQAVDWAAGVSVPLLAPVTQAGTLYIGLTGTARDLSLLFRLAPPAGGWPTDTPPLNWAQALDGGGWLTLTPLSDTTNGLRNAGIVRLPLADVPLGAPLLLRVSVAADPTRFPTLAGLATNAATASWQGPGGASALGLPLPAGTVTRSLAPVPGLGTVAQPMPSGGGQPAAQGPAFDLWLAERLRHKDRGVQAWDLAHLLLAAFPSLWQVAVVPASNGGARPAPGHVWIVPVPGPRTPAIADPTIPSNDAEMLSQVGAYLAGRVSPFVQLTVSNPPYQRLKVVADLVFTDDDSVQACINRLNEELIAYLSPWPAPDLGPRPHDYYTRKEVAHFVRHRPYVRGILSLRLMPEGPDGTPALDAAATDQAPGAQADEPQASHHRYFTSATSHALTGRATPASELVRPVRARRPAPAAVVLGGVA